MQFHRLCATYLEHHLSRTASHALFLRLYKQYFASWPDQHPDRMAIRAWHRTVADTPSQGNKGLGFLRAMYHWAINEGLHHDNPATGIRRHRTYSRERVMTIRELMTLLQSLDGFTPKMQAFIVLLLTTGCRGGEARTARWDQLDLQFGVWTKSKTKNGRTQRMPIPKQACRLIAALPRVSDYPFAGHYGHPLSMAAVEKSWGIYRAALNLHDVTLHDFRRTFSTRLYAQTEDVYLCKAALNHYDGSPTAIYVKLQFDKLAQALQRQADELFALTDATAVNLEEFSFAS